MKAKLYFRQISKMKCCRPEIIENNTFYTDTLIIVIFFFIKTVWTNKKGRKTKPQSSVVIFFLPEFIIMNCSFFIILNSFYILQ